MTYYNTTHVDGAELVRYRKTTESQEEAVERFFRETRRLWSPEDVQRHVMPDSPRHSVSRAMSNLKKRRVIEKTSRQVRGQYDRPIYLWRLCEPKQEPLL